MTLRRARVRDARALRHQLRAVGVRVDLPTSVRLATVARRESTAAMLHQIPGWEAGECSWQCSSHPGEQWAAVFRGGRLEVDCCGGIVAVPSA